MLTRRNIKHELTSPYSPHQNGTSERNWRTLFEMARSLLIDSGLPKYLWTYALMTATHIRNRCYVQCIKNTPYSLITGRKPNIAQLHIFGTVCYSYNHNNVKKLDPRCKKGYFVGYDRNIPSYLVYYSENRTVMKHRLVKFTKRFEHTDDVSEPDFRIKPADTADVKAEVNPKPKLNQLIQSLLNRHN
jgi:Integrase core domain.